MTKEDRFVTILGIVESDSNPQAWGDHGRAMGRFQWHPLTLWMYWARAVTRVGTTPTWDQLAEAAVRVFYEMCEEHDYDKSDLQRAMAFHLHGYMVWTGWETEYADKWEKAAARFDQEVERLKV